MTEIAPLFFHYSSKNVKYLWRCVTYIVVWFYLHCKSCNLYNCIIYEQILYAIFLTHVNIHLYSRNWWHNSFYFSQVLSHILIVQVIWPFLEIDFQCLSVHFPFIYTKNYNRYSLVGEATAVSILTSLRVTDAIFWWYVARINIPAISDNIVMNVSRVGAVLLLRSLNELWNTKINIYHYFEIYRTITLLEQKGV